MKKHLLHLLFPAVTVLLGQAGAAQVQLGLQAAANLPVISSTASVMGGGHMAALWNVNGTLKFRPVLEGNLSSGFAPSLRLDLDLLKVSGAAYYGAGLGSGLMFDMTDGGSGLPGIVLSPVALLNGHAFYGTTFNNTYVEGLFRLGPISSAGVRFGLWLP